MFVGVSEYTVTAFNPSPEPMRSAGFVSFVSQ